MDQELIASQTNVQYKSHFWARKNVNSNAEVDVVFQQQQNIIPVKIKSGSKGKLRSPHEFIDRAEHSIGIRLLANKVSVDKSKTRTGKSYTLLNIPYSLAFKFSEYADWAAQ